MAQVKAQSDSTLVREHARNVYVKAAIRQGEKFVKVNVGAVHKALTFTNRVPLVCAALRSKKFLSENNLKLVSQTGPPSGQSTTVTFTYEILGTPGAPDVPLASFKPLMALRGIAKDVFQKLGGGEAFIRKERNNFETHVEKREEAARK